jgi:putative flavoprotein involved in K+ transport
LTDANLEHVVLERGRLAERWRSERWDSLRLLSPNWATRLPAWHYTGSDPDGFMRADELVSYLEAYARSFAAPIEHGVAVRSVATGPHGFVVRTDDEAWHANAVVVATGWSDQPRVPSFATDLDSGIAQFTAHSYRNPSQLPDGGVLVVGASASGVQLADELARAGREVVLAVGSHSRAVRRYRGTDIWRWFEDAGVFADTIDEAADPRQATYQGSVQLIGNPDHRDVDLPALQRLGVRLAGRLIGAEGRSASFANDLVDTTTAAYEALSQTLARIDAYIDRSGLGAHLAPADPLTPICAEGPRERLDLRAQGISSVLWTFGYFRRYEWLHVPALDAIGEIAHTRGVTPQPGLYVVGQRFQHRRDSNFIDGVRHDAAFIVNHLVARRGVSRSPRALHAVTKDARRLDVRVAP